LPAAGMRYEVLAPGELAGFPKSQPEPLSGKKEGGLSPVLRLLPFGHVRFFEVVAGLGDLFVVVGNDENVRLLKAAITHC